MAETCDILSNAMKLGDNISITKASGKVEPFSGEKLTSSLRRSNASNQTVQAILEHIGTELKDGMSTRDIYQHAFSLLKRYEHRAAIRYKLRRALMELGPGGHPFERLVGEILKSQGFEVEIGKIIPGECVSHEVDVLARKGEKHIIVEAKFHNEQGIKTDVKVSLYVHARFRDIEKRHERLEHHEGKIDEAWLITNTKFTADAIKYGKCANIRMIGWNYPEDGNLQDLIEDSKLHPVTCLSTLSITDKQKFLNNGVVLCREILNEDGSLSPILKVDEGKVREIMEEVNLVCTPR